MSDGEDENERRLFQPPDCGERRRRLGWSQGLFFPLLITILLKIGTTHVHWAVVEFQFSIADFYWPNEYTKTGVEIRSFGDEKRAARAFDGRVVATATNTC